MKLFDRSMERLTIVQIAPDYYPVPPPAYGGIERIVHTLTEQLVRLGHRVILYAPEGSDTGAELIPYTHGQGNPEAILATVVRTLPKEADIIHDHTHSSVIGRRRLPVPTLCTLHATVNNGIDNPVYISESSLFAAGGGAGDYVYNGIDPSDYEYAERKSDYLLFLGVISPHKGVHHALHIAESTGRRLILAGPVFSADYFSSDIEPVLRRCPNIEYVGEVGGKEKRRLLKEARCLLFPTCCEEAFGLVMAEAMASGTPVLALARGAVEEVMSGFPGLVCRTVEEMAAKAEAGDFPGSAALRDYALRRFTHEEMARRYEELYRRLLERSEPSVDGIGEWKSLQRDDLALSLCEDIIRREGVSTEDKLRACNEAAELCHARGDSEGEKAYIYRSFDIAAPRAEFCCRLGYYHLRREDYAKAAYWYRLATQIERPQGPGSFCLEACWTWLPHIQLCVCSYHLGDVEGAYRHNELARSYRAEDRLILFNKSFLEPLLGTRAPEPEGRQEIRLTGPTGEAFRMSLRLPGFIEETIRDKGAWEPELSRTLSRYMKPGSIFVDIGANIGYHTMFIASMGEEVSCVSFEPHRVLFRQLEQNAKLSGLDNVTLCCHAIGDYSGQAEFYLQKEESYNRGLSGSKLSAGTNKEEFILGPVAVKTLDEALSSRQQRQTGVIKIDTQGFEYEAIRGASETIRLSRPVIAFEYHAYGSHRLDDILGLLPGYGIYKLQVWSGEVRRLDEPDPAGFEQDYICIPGHLEL